METYRILLPLFPYLREILLMDYIWISSLETFRLQNDALGDTFLKEVLNLIPFKVLFVYFSSKIIKINEHEAVGNFTVRVRS